MKKYWYHISRKLNKRGTFILDPWGNELASNRPSEEPDGKRIPVAPTIEQCIIAIPLYDAAIINVYRTKEMVETENPINVFDSEITEEGWITVPTEFIYIGKIDFNWIDYDENDIDFTVCCHDDLDQMKYMLAIWKRINLERYLKI